jgi:hypothetical protein
MNALPQANTSPSVEKDSPSNVVEESMSPEAEETTNAPFAQKKTFLQELNPWSGINPGIEKDNNFFFLLIRPWTMVIYPAVIYSFLVFAFTLACAIGVLNTAASIFQSPPYNMTPGVQSLINIPLTLGIVLGSYCGGELTDRYLAWRVKKNNGIFEPEFRLVTLILPFLIVPAGVLMYFDIFIFLEADFLGTDLVSRIYPHGYCHLLETHVLDLV